MLNKKEFQKVVSMIRKEIGCTYPKAMMTGQQENNNTATVNCGADWHKGLYSHKISETVMGDDRFQSLMKKYGATAHIEKAYQGVQVRINYPD